MKDRKDLISVLTLLIISMIAYLPLVGKFGYYNDDWYLMYSAGAYGPGVFWDIFSVDRPLRALVMVPAYYLFGENPLYYDISAYVFRVISAVAFLWLLEMIWPRRYTATFLASLFFLIYPGFLSQFNGIDYQSQMVGLATAMLSIALTVKASLTDRIWVRIILIAVSTVLGWLYLGLVEYFLGFEFLRFACLSIFGFRKSAAWKNRLLESVKRWLPNIFTPLIFLGWRLFFFQSERGATDVGMQFEQVKLYPVQIMYRWSLQIAQDMFDVMIGAWIEPLSQLVGFFQAWGGWLALAVAGLVVFTLLKKRIDLRENTERMPFHREALWLGLTTAIACLIPIAMANRQVAFPHFSRYALASSSGVAICFAAILVNLKNNIFRNGLVALLVFISIITHHANAVKFAQTTSATDNFWWQVSWRVPQFEKNTTLVASYPNIVLEEDYFVWGPANLIYYPQKQKDNDIQPVLFSIIMNKDTVKKILAREGQDFNNRRNIITYANARNILVLTQPTANSCVHVIDGMQPELSPKDPDFIRAVGAYSEIDHVLVNETPHTPPSLIFGPEPSHSWCFYYEQADLARQRGEWGQVLAIGEQAKGQGLEPVDLIEWMPFLQAYAVTGNVERLIDLAPTIATKPFISMQACHRIKAMPELSDSILGVVDTYYCIAP